MPKHKTARNMDAEKRAQGTHQREYISVCENDGCCWTSAAQDSSVTFHASPAGCFAPNGKNYIQ